MVTTKEEKAKQQSARDNNGCYRVIPGRSRNNHVACAFRV